MRLLLFASSLCLCQERLSLFKTDVNAAFRRVPIKESDRKYAHVVFIYEARGGLRHSVVRCCASCRVPGSNVHRRALPIAVWINRISAWMGSNRRARPLFHMGTGS